MVNLSQLKWGLKMGKITGIIVILAIVSGGYFFLIRQQNYTEDSPSVTYPSTQPSTETNILDFEELSRFDSLEQIGDYRFEMRVGKVYRLQDKEYHYLGDGKMLVKDFGDPEYIKEYRWMLQVGVGPVIGAWGNDEMGKALPGRGYSTTVIKVEAKTVLLRIEEIHIGPA